MVYDVLWEQIQLFVNMHNAVYNSWHNCEEFNKSLNFNAIEIRDVDENNDYRFYIYQYRNFLSKVVVPLNLELVSKGFIKARVKEILSLSAKIDRAMLNPRVNNGAVKVHKLLNDIFGSRIILAEDFDYDELSRKINEQFCDVQARNSCNSDGYKAVHVYTKAEKGHFKWELQIWRKSDAVSNEVLHKKYKRDYINKLEKISEEE